MRTSRIRPVGYFMRNIGVMHTHTHTLDTAFMFSLTAINSWSVLLNIYNTQFTCLSTVSITVQENLHALIKRNES